MLFIKLDQLFIKRKKEALIFLQFIKKYDYSLIFRHSLFTIHFFWLIIHYSLQKGPLFTNHYTTSRPLELLQRRINPR